MHVKVDDSPVDTYPSAHWSEHVFPEHDHDAALAGSGTAAEQEVNPSRRGAPAGRVRLGSGASDDDVASSKGSRVELHGEGSGAATSSCSALDDSGPEHNTRRRTRRSGGAARILKAPCCGTIAQRPLF
jgi:hypothetical protein